MDGDHFLLTCPLQISVARPVWFCAVLSIPKGSVWKKGSVA